MSEYQAALVNGEIAQERKPQDASVQQMATGAKQLGTGAKNFLANRVAPAAVSAGKSIQGAVSEHSSQAQSGSSWRAWVPFALPAFALIGFISVFLPVGSASASVSGWGRRYSQSASFFDQEAGGVGGLLVFFMLVVLALGIVAVLVHKRWARITAGVAGLTVGALSAFIAFGTMASIAGASGSGPGFSVNTSVGAGIVLLAIASLGMIAVSISTFLPAKHNPAPAPDETP